MILINLFGAPGAGKSTGAAYIFSQLKMRGVNVELVTEFAKDKVWEKSVEVFNNQAYIFGKQYFRISRCANQVDVIVTDSPLILSIIYNNNPVLGKDFDKVVLNVSNSYNNRNYFLTREVPYSSIGRIHTEEESNQISNKIYQLLVDNNIDFTLISGTENGYNKIVESICKELGK
jgi:hypothetical protein